MPEHDWSRFTKRVPINVDEKDIFEAWATQEALEKWFLRKAEFTKLDKTIRDRNSHIEKGDVYNWLWYGWSDDVVERGTILEANGKNLLQFTFGKAGIVTVKIKNQEGISLVELIQESIPVNEKAKVLFHLGCSTGWVFYLTNLKSILEGGVDLRNRNEKLKNVVNA